MAVFRRKALRIALVSRRARGFIAMRAGSSGPSAATPASGSSRWSVYNGALYAGSYDYGRFVRYNGEANWTDLGQVPDTDQVYSFAVYQGRLYTLHLADRLGLRLRCPEQLDERRPAGRRKGSHGRGRVQREALRRHAPLGRPSFATTARTLDLDRPARHTPDVNYRRVWSMAVYQGRLFAGTLPSGRVYSLEAGKCATYDRELAAGLAARRGGEGRGTAQTLRRRPMRGHVFSRSTRPTTTFPPSRRCGSASASTTTSTGGCADLRLYRRWWLTRRSAPWPRRLLPALPRACDIQNRQSLL